jgi:hypothetical protein
MSRRISKAKKNEVANKIISFVVEIRDLEKQKEQIDDLIENRKRFLEGHLNFLINEKVHF